MISASDIPRPPPAAATCSKGLAARITLHNCSRSSKATITTLAIVAGRFSAATIANKLSG